jgi:serine/threonine protein kinase
MRTFFIFLSFFIFGMSLAAVQPPTKKNWARDLSLQMQASGNENDAGGSSPGDTPTTASDNPSGRQVRAVDPGYPTFPSLPLPDFTALSSGLSGLSRNKPSTEKPLKTPPAPNKDNRLFLHDVAFLQDSYRSIEILGNGSQATVFKAINGDGETVALKVKQAPRGDFETNREVEFIKILNREELIKYFESFYIKDNFTNKTFAVIEMPLYKQNLSQYAASFHSQGIRFPEVEIWVLIKRMALALKALEEMHIVHLDIKPDNIFLNDDCSSAVLGDFGLLQMNGTPNDLKNEGDARFGALEFTRAAEVTHTLDVASLGLALFSLISTIELPNGCEVWESLRKDQAFAESYIVKGYSYGLTSLILRLMGPAEQRPNAVVILDAVELLAP